MPIEPTDPADPGIRLHDLERPEDIATVHRWFLLPYAVYWGMQDHSLAQTAQAYAQMQASGHARALLGWVDGEPGFVLETYDPAHDPLGRCYPVQPGDRGMHFFVGPPSGARQPGHTRRVFRAILRFMFDRQHARRVVVEPDVRNDKIHALNRAMGFANHGELQLPHKRAVLAFCTRDQFLHATSKDFTA